MKPNCYLRSKVPLGNKRKQAIMKTQGGVFWKSTLLFLAVLAIASIDLQAQSSVTWSNTGGNAWLTGTNWSTNNPPGTLDTAVFGANPTGSTASAGVGVNFGVMGSPASLNNGTFNGASGLLGDEAVGAISVTSARSVALFIGNTKSSSTNLSGYMTLNGATINGQTNTILSNFNSGSTSNSILTIQNNVQGSTGSTFGLVLGNTTNYVQTAVGTSSKNGASIVITSTIDQVNSGSSIALLGGGASALNGGVLELGGSNSFTGGITIGNSAGTQGGTVQIDTAASLPTTGSIVVYSNGQLLLSGTSGSTYGGVAQSLTLNGVGTVSSSGALRTGVNGTWQGTTSFGSNTIISVTGSATFTLSGNVTDNGFQLQKQGGGTLTLSGTGNVLTGSTQIGNGTVTVSSGSSLGMGALALAQTSTNNTALTLNNASQSVGSLSSSFSATTGSQTQVITLNGTALTVIQTTSGTYGQGAVSTLTSTIAGSGSLILGAASTATLTLTGANTYSGGTMVSAGTLQVGVSSATTGSGSGMAITSGATGTGLLTVNGGTVDLSNFSLAVAGLSGAGGVIGSSSTSTPASLTIVTNATPQTYSGVIADTTAGGTTTGATQPVSVIVNGSGTQTLNGVNTYSGTTTVNSGTLALGSSGSLSSASQVTVNSGGTLLMSGGNTINNVNGNVTLNGGTIAMGASTTGQTIGTLTLSATSTINFSTFASILSFADSHGIAWTGTLNIYNWTSSDSLFFGNSSTGLTSAQANQIAFYSGGGSGFLGDGAISSGGQVTPQMSPVPEPSTVFVGLSLLALAAYRERRRFRFLGCKVAREASVA